MLQASAIVGRTLIEIFGEPVEKWLSNSQGEQYAIGRQISACSQPNVEGKSCKFDDETTRTLRGCGESPKFELKNTTLEPVQCRGSFSREPCW